MKRGDVSKFDYNHSNRYIFQSNCRNLHISVYYIVSAIGGRKDLHLKEKDIEKKLRLVNF